ncbi:MAG: hypothetical protein ABEH61_05280 [Haloarculaceae archaeon]
MGLRDRYSRPQWAVLLVCLALQAVNTTAGYYVFDWLGVGERLLLPLVVVAGGLFVLPVVAVVILSPRPPQEDSEYQYDASEFDDP